MTKRGKHVLDLQKGPGWWGIQWATAEQAASRMRGCCWGSAQLSSCPRYSGTDCAHTHVEGTAIKPFEKHDYGILENVRVGSMSMGD